MSICLLSVLVALLVTPACSQGDNGWPKWPEWPPWPPGDWPEWPEWPAWKDSATGTVSTPAPTPVPTPTPVPVTTPTPEPTPTPVPVTTEVVATTADVEAAASALFGDLDSDSATVAGVLTSRPELSFFYDTAVATELLDVFEDEDFMSTIFVPTNNAMAAVLASLGYLTFEAFIQDKDKAEEILLYHIVAGDTVAFSTDLTDKQFINMLSSQVLNTQVDLSDGVAIQGLGSKANVVEADIAAGKSVIHIIDAVLLPFDAAIDKEVNTALQELGTLEFESIMQLVEKVPSLSTFASASEAANMIPFLDATNFMGSIFIPSNQGFLNGLSNLGLDTLDDLLNDPDLLQTILVNHIVSTPLFVSELEMDQQLETLGEETVTVNGAPFLTIVSDGAAAKVIDHNIVAGDVVVYIIDDVLLPWEMTDDLLEKIEIVTLFN